MTRGRGGRGGRTVLEKPIPFIVRLFVVSDREKMSHGRGGHTVVEKSIQYIVPLFGGWPCFGFVLPFALLLNLHFRVFRRGYNRTIAQPGENLGFAYRLRN